MNCLFSTAYWPNLYYVAHVLDSTHTVIEQYEHYQKQSYRNRCRILSANGVLDLTIPIVNPGHKQLSKDVAICYKENWQTKHWRALESAYKNSPYFEYFEPEIFALYSNKTASLLEFNFEQLQLLLRLLRSKKNIALSEAFEAQPASRIDLREKIHPKRMPDPNDPVVKRLQTPYYQVFAAKFGFSPNLSILDLFFNKGLQSIDYLHGKA